MYWTCATKCSLEALEGTACMDACVAAHPAAQGAKPLWDAWKECVALSCDDECVL